MAPVKTVLVTGCSDGGLGAALCLAFHKQRYRVLATARNQDKMATLAAVDGIELLTLDVTSEESVEKCARQVATLTGGGLDVLVNNAGRDYFNSLLDSTIDETKALFDTNVYSILRVTQSFVPLLRKSQNRPLIVNNTSVCAVVPLPFNSIYNASKAAASMLTENLRIELAPLNIRAVELRTGAVRSNIIANRSLRADSSGGLPTSSAYWVIRQYIERRSEGIPVEEQITASEWARSVVKELSKNNVPLRIWKGGSATLAWLSTFLPVGVLDNMLKKNSGLLEMESLIGKNQRN